MIAAIYARKSTELTGVSEEQGVTHDTSGILQAVFVGRATGGEGDDALIRTLCLQGERGRSYDTG